MNPCLLPMKRISVDDLIAIGKIHNYYIYLLMENFD